jgi:DNA-directed RNA polymerase specialized sigma24 family protein
MNGRDNFHSEDESMSETKRERIDRLYTELRDRKPGATEKLILEFVPVVDEAAKTFAYRRPAFCRLRDDFVGAGYLKITEIIMAAPTSDQVDNFRSFVLKSLDREFAKMCDEDSLVGAGHTVMKEAAQNNNPRPRPESFEPVKEEHAQYEEQQYAYALSDVLRCCDGEFEEDVIAMRAAGRTDRQIAARFKVSDTTVLRARHRVERRFLETDMMMGA